MRAAAWVLGLFLAVAAHGQDQRLPVPDAKTQADAEKLIRDVFKEDYARKAPADRLALAKKLLQQGMETRDDPAARFVLLREARDLASAAGDVETAIKAVDAISKGFEGDVAAMKAAVLVAAGKAAKSPEEFGRLARSYLELANDAAALEQYDLAERSAEQASSFAKKAKDVPLVAKLDVRWKEMAQLRSKSEKVVKAREALAVNPDDPAANLAIGQYLSFVKGDWEKGLRHLAKGSDGPLKALAAKDLGRPSEAAEQTALGDAWWEFGEKEEGGSRGRLRSRAAFWYSQARDRTTGLTRLKLDQRIATAGTPAPGRGAVDLLTLIDPQKNAIHGLWKSTDGKLVSPAIPLARIEIPYAPPEEYDLRLVVQKENRPDAHSVDIGLVAGNSRVLVIIDGWSGTLSCLSLVDGKFLEEASYKGKAIAGGAPSTIVCSVRKNRLAVTVDGKTILDWAADYRRVSLEEVWKTPNAKALFVGSYQTCYQFSKIEIVPWSAEDSSEIDLLARIDPKVDSIKGTWTMAEGKLLTPVVIEPKFAACAVPYAPPAEYDLTIVAERRSGKSSLLVGLIGGGKQFGLELDGHDGPSGKSFSGLDRIDRASALTNGAGFRGGIFADGKTHTVVCRVRKDHVAVALDGQEVLQWVADYRRVSRHDCMTVLNEQGLFLGAWHSEYLIHRFSVKPVTGEGRFQR